MTKAIAVQCKAISKQTKERCKRKAIPGGEVCRWHGGAAKQVQAKAAIRAEVLSWGLTDATIDPGEQLLRLVTQSAARAEMYAQELKDGPPYYNSQGDRVDLNGRPCGNGPYGHSYNGAQECWVP
jgi:hypothetical protein